LKEGGTETSLTGAPQPKEREKGASGFLYRVGETKPLLNLYGAASVLPRAPCIELFGDGPAVCGGSVALLSDGTAVCGGSVAFGQGYDRIRSWICFSKLKIPASSRPLSRLPADLRA
jgi:hypothetical protein